MLSNSAKYLQFSFQSGKKKTCKYSAKIDASDLNHPKALTVPVKIYLLVDDLK